MFVVPWAHRFPNIVLGLENSGSPGPGRETRSSVLLNPKACARENPQAATHLPQEEGWSQMDWLRAVRLVFSMGEGPVEVELKRWLSHS